VVAAALRYFRDTSRSVFAHFEDELLPSLRRGLESEDPERRECVLEVIALAGLGGSVPLITPMLESESENERREGVNILQEIGHPAAIGPLGELLDGKRAVSRGELPGVIRALSGIDPRWPIRESAPAWLREVGLLIDEYRRAYLPHRENTYLREMFRACGAGGQPVKEVQGTEEDALAVFAELEKIAARIRKARARIKSKRRREIINASGYWAFHEQIESFPRCKKQK
jgi:hypothetical protein